MKISAVLIVKNEATCIEKVLASLAGIDEIIVCDTGSTDDTMLLAHKHGARVFNDYEWEDSFAKARNHALSKATGDWVLSIDADEELKTPVEEVRAAAAASEEKGFKVAMVKLTGAGTENSHRFTRLFKRCEEVFWKGAAHNYLSVAEDNLVEVEIEYGYSDAHKLDPDRTLRILEKACAETPELVREKYYLAREYWYRKRYDKALDWYQSYLKVATWAPEKADALLMAARCLWQLQRGSEARAACLQAIGINPEFQEALYFMAEMHFSPWKESWEKIAAAADNSNVLFVRKVIPRKEVAEAKTST